MISVIVPTYDNPVGVMRCLNTLVETASRDVPCELIVADDCGPHLLYGALPECVSIYRGEKNVGFSGNCNMAAERAEGRILFFVNDDVYAMTGLSDGWDVHLVEALAGLDTGVVGCKLLFPNDSIQHAGMEFDVDCQPHHRFFQYRDHRYRPANEPGVVKMVTGAAFAVAKDCWDAVGGFDAERYPSYFGDAAFCLKAAQLGYNTWYEPKATFYHLAGATAGRHRDIEGCARRFREEWVDSGFAKPDTLARMVDYWK